MSRCDEFRIHVANSGFDVSHFNKHVQDHLNHCNGCNSYINAIPFFNQSLNDLPVYDAPKKLIANTISKIIEYDDQQKQKIVTTNHKRINKFAFSFTAIATAGLIYQLQPYFTVVETDSKNHITTANKIMRFPTSPFSSPLHTLSQGNNENRHESLNLGNNSYNLQTLLTESSILDQSSATVAHQSNSGYWSTSYLADASERSTVFRQKSYWKLYDFSRLFGFSNSLDSYSWPVPQSFEKPTQSALAIYLATDRSMITGSTRMRMQIAIQARDYPIATDEKRKIIAKSLSLRINLASGVKLYNIIGSSPIGSTETTYMDISQQFNVVNNASEANIATKNTDKSESIPGIQIYIPDYYASDSHVILLDILAEEPGNIADVSLLYKDLLFQKNGLNHANLTLGRQTEIPQKQIDNVSKNLLAQEISQTLQLSSTLLEDQNRHMALNNIVSLKDKLTSMRSTSIKWKSDIDITKDNIMLNNFITAFNTLQLDNVQHQQYLQHALKLAAWRKLGYVQQSNSEQ